jgi:hypothetical protein
MTIVGGRDNKIPAGKSKKQKTKNKTALKVECHDVQRQVQSNTTSSQRSNIECYYYGTGMHQIA